MKITPVVNIAKPPAPPGTVRYEPGTVRYAGGVGWCGGDEDGGGEGKKKQNHKKNIQMYHLQRNNSFIKNMEQLGLYRKR